MPQKIIIGILGILLTVALGCVLAYLSFIPATHLEISQISFGVAGLGIAATFGSLLGRTAAMVASISFVGAYIGTLGAVYLLIIGSIR